jgi:acyl carrier protein
VQTNKAFTASSIYNQEAIQTWLVEQVAQITGLLPHQIDIAQPFSSYRIDSVAAAGLSGELANWLGVRLAPTITWDYPSVRLLASHLASYRLGTTPCAA